MTSHRKAEYLSQSVKYIRSTLHNSTAINAQEVAGALALLLADMYGLYFKTKDVYKILSERSLSTYHDLLDSHGREILFTARLLAECVHKLGGTLHRWPVILDHLQRTSCVDAADRLPSGLLVELLEQNAELALHMREAKWLCDEYGDTDSAILLDECIKEVDRRVTLLAQPGA
jgi:starvation-inducible DNA-binding protein